MLDTWRAEDNLGSQLSPSQCEPWGLTSALHLLIDKWIDFETRSQTLYVDEAAQKLCSCLLSAGIKDRHTNCPASLPVH